MGVKYLLFSEDLIVIGGRSSPRLEEHSKAVPILNLGHFFIPTSPRMEKRKQPIRQGVPSGDGIPQIGLI
jgi:hypothetical protein